METAKGFQADFFSFARILWPSWGVFSKAGGRRNRRRAPARPQARLRCTDDWTAAREHADEEDPRALQDATGPGGGERAPDRAGVSRARAKGAAGRSLPGPEARRRHL